jgi:hypothetical protein
VSGRACPHRDIEALAVSGMTHMSFWETVLAVWIVIAVIGGVVMLVSVRTDLYD